MKYRHKLFIGKWEWNAMKCVFVLSMRLFRLLFLLHFEVSICWSTAMANDVGSWNKIILKEENNNGIIVFSFALNSFVHIIGTALQFLPPNISIWKVNFNNDVVNGSLDSIKQSSIACRQCGSYVQSFVVLIMPFLFIRIWIHVVRLHRPIVSFCSHYFRYFHQVFWKVNCRK